MLLLLGRLDRALFSQDPLYRGRSAQLFPLFLFLFLVLMFHFVDILHREPDTWMAPYLAEYGPLQNIQALFLLAALAVIVQGFLRSGRPGRGLWALLLGPGFFLLWREGSLDKEILASWLGYPGGVRMFSWRYLWEAERFPPLLRLVFGTVSLGLTAAWLGLVWRHRRDAWAEVRRAFVPKAVFWAAVSLSCLFVAQLWDKASSVKKHLGLELNRLQVSNPFVEEGLETLGEFSFLLFVLTLRGMTLGTLRDRTAAA